MQILMRLMIALAALIALPVAAAAEGRRVALVIANSAYAQVTPLANPVNDGKLVADALKKAGFTVDLRDNLDLSHFMHALRDFRGQADGADVALIYYAGHGAQAEGQNYLIPTDAEMAAERDLDAEGVDLERFMTTLGGARLRIAIVDACRNNPFRAAQAAAAVTNGLAQVDVDDVLVIFSAAPGQTAADGDGANSPFAQSLARRLPQPGLLIQRLGGVVRDDVIASTANRQRPFISQSITGEPIFLVPGTQIAATSTPAPGGGGTSALRGTRAPAPPPPPPPAPAITFTDRWTATDPRLPMSSVTVERAETADQIVFRVSGTYPLAKRTGEPAPQARVIRAVAYRVEGGRVALLPRWNRFKIGSWAPGAPFTTTVVYPKPAPGAAMPPEVAIRLCMGENDGPGQNFCFYSPNLVKGGAQQLMADMPGARASVRPAGRQGMQPGMMRRPRRQ